MAPKKAVVLGLDGATFDLLLPRVERGHMPHLAALLARGAWGSLRSTTPPFSAQAWVSLATGHNQARHGVVDFWQRGADLSPGQRREFVDARQVHTETLWQVAGRRGLRVGLVNVPVTFPPSPVNGYLVSGFLTPQGRDDWAYPPGLRDEVLGLVPGYEPDPFDPLGSSYRQLQELVDWMEKHEKVARHLAGSRPADLFFSVVQALDHLQHLFWDEVAGDSDREAYVALAERCYRLADEAIGHRAALAGDEATLFLVSDHGFGPARKWFHVNRFLQELGLLVLGAGGEGAAGTTAARLGLTPEKMRGLVRRLDVLGLRRWVGRLARVSLGRRLDERLTPPVDWGRTRAISGSPATEGIFINRDLVADSGDYEALRRRLAAELLALRDPESGEAVVEAVYRREEIYDGPFLEQLPDLVFDLGRRPYLAGDSLTADRVLAPLPRDYLQGRHRPLGIFAAAGPNIRPAGRLEGPLKEGPLKEGPLKEAPSLRAPASSTSPPPYSTPSTCPSPRTSTAGPCWRFSTTTTAPPTLSATPPPSAPARAADPPATDPPTTTTISTRCSAASRAWATSARRRLKRLGVHRQDAYGRRFGGVAGPRRDYTTRPARAHFAFGLSRGDRKIITYRGLEHPFPRFALDAGPGQGAGVAGVGGQTDLVGIGGTLQSAGRI